MKYNLLVLLLRRYLLDIFSYSSSGDSIMRSVSGRSWKVSTCLVKPVLLGLSILFLLQNLYGQTSGMHYIAFCTSTEAATFNTNRDECC